MVCTPLPVSSKLRLGKQNDPRPNSQQLAHLALVSMAAPVDDQTQQACHLALDVSCVVKSTFVQEVGKYNGN